MTTTDIPSFKDILASKKKIPKPPAYPWQDLALRIITELSIPSFKRSAVFKVCRNCPKELILRAMNDTKELSGSGEQWRYFFKVIDSEIKGKGYNQ